MESFEFKNVSFAYPEAGERALNNLSFSIKKGEFVILCGRSGCGKSTLLRHTKTALAPKGNLRGEVLFEGRPLCEVPERTQAQKIGFVMQSPENQVVTDKVWHELSFGLENLGEDSDTIRRRVAEVAAFFGIEDWFYKNVSELSGGQKQLLALASVMAMQPSCVVLDEPTAQLDPIAAGEFLALLGKINRELGVTVIMAEHRLEEAIPYATRLVVMEKGEIACSGAPREAALSLRNRGDGMFLAMPASARVWARLETDEPCPLNTAEGAAFLETVGELRPLKEEKIKPVGETVLSADELWFRYEKDAPDVLKGLSIELHRGEIYALLGGNGAGKTTALRALAGLSEPYRGEVKRTGRVSLLPQSPQTLFVKKTLRDDLFDAAGGEKNADMQSLEYLVSLCSLDGLLSRHPFDLSGGEQQRAALCKLLLTKPDILLLDEPTKGFDAEFKRSFAALLKKLARSGAAILLVSHDVEFCAECADRCGMFFDGGVVAEGTPRSFFAGNSFYTTSANRMVRSLLPEAVTVSDILYSCGVSEPEDEPVLDVKPLEISELEPKEGKKLPPWRRLTAGISALSALIIFIYAAKMTNLASLGDKPLWLYGAFLASLAVFIASVYKKSDAPIPDYGKRAISKRTKAASALIIVLIPLTLFVWIKYLNSAYYNLCALVVLFECMAPFFLIFEGRRPQARELAVIAVLCAIGIAGRAAFFMLPQFKPVLALTIIAGVALGGEAGFLVGAVTMLASNMLMSQGPWTPWQMFAMGLAGFLAGVVFRKGFLLRSRAALCSFGVLAAIIVYGGIMNFASAVMWSPQSLSTKMLLGYYVSGFPADLIHAAATVIFLWLAALPMLEKLDRIKVKYDLLS